MKLFDREYFVIRNADGTYYTGLAKLNGETGIDYSPQYPDLEEALRIVNYRKSKGIECEIVPIRVIIKEIKKRDILCYNHNHILDLNGWSLRPDAHMNFFWKHICDGDAFWALTD